MNSYFYNILIGFIIASVISITAWRLRALNISGMLAALFVGSMVFGLGGVAWALLLIAFFVTSSSLSLINKNKADKMSQNFAKGSQRDWAQVLANSGVAAILIIIHEIRPETDCVWLAFAASLAAANADTWSTELGVLSPQQPRLITSFKKADKGTSGAVTAHGCLAGFTGSLLIAALAVLFWQGSSRYNLWIVLLIISFSGLAGSLVDSLAGATIQAVYTCHQCQKETEQHPLHVCGSPTSLKRGIPLFNNDVVNICCTLSGALTAAIAYFIIL